MPSKGKTQVTKEKILEAHQFVRERLIGPRQTEYFSSEHSQVLYDLLDETVEHGRSNSILIIGPRGSGKTSLIKDVVSRLSATHGGDTFKLIKLNGIIHHDDYQALKEIASQCRLAEQLEKSDLKGFAEILHSLLKALQLGNKTKSLPLIIILEEFDLFAGHKNQTLLYNLFDIAQSRQAPVVVVGASTRLDVLDLLEKRVKSRFSHRQIHLTTKLSFPQYMDLFKNIASLPKDFPHSLTRRSWNQAVEELAGDAIVRDVLMDQFCITKEVRLLQMLVLNALLICGGPFTSSAILQAARRRGVDAKVALLRGLPALEICLVIAMHHLTLVHQGAPANLRMVYEEYKKFSLSSKSSSVKNFSFAVVAKAFEHLQELEIVLPAEGRQVGAGSGMMDFTMMRLQVTPDQLLDTVTSSDKVPLELTHWVTSSTH